MDSIPCLLKNTKVDQANMNFTITHFSMVLFYVFLTTVNKIATLLASFFVSFFLLMFFNFIETTSLSIGFIIGLQNTMQMSQGPIF